MKHVKQITVAVILVVLSLTLCFFSLGKDNDSAIQAKENDLTVKIPELQLTNYSLENTINVMADASFCTSAWTLKELNSNSQDIVRGIVKQCSFIVHEGLPLTKIDLVITESYKGTLKENDVISIVRYGGYIPLKEEINFYKNEVKFFGITKNKAENTLIEKKLTDEDYPKSGETHLYFLNPEPLVKGAYSPVNEYEGSFKLSEEQKFERYEAAESQEYINEFSNQWLKNELKKLKAN